MVSTNPCSFEEEACKTEDKNRGLECIKAKQTAVVLLESVLGKRKAQHLKLTEELSTCEPGYRVEFEKLEEALSLYNKQVKDVLEKLTKYERAIVMAVVTSIKNEYEHEWLGLWMTEPQEIFVPEEVITEENATVEEVAKAVLIPQDAESAPKVSENQTLSDEISAAGRDIDRIKLHMLAMSNVKASVADTKGILELRGTFDKQYVDFLQQKRKILRTTLYLREVTNRIITLEQNIKTKKHELEKAKKLWMENWEYFSRQITKDDEMSMELWRNKHADVLPFIHHGIAIRGRMIESLQEKWCQDSSIIDLGNGAAHEGAALTDALLYDESFPQSLRRTDIYHFTAIYGVTPNFVLQHRECAPLMSVLNMNGSLKAYRKTLEAAEMDSGSYRTGFDAVERKIKNFSTEEMETFWEGEEGKQAYDQHKEVFLKTACAYHDLRVRNWDWLRR